MTGIKKLVFSVMSKIAFGHEDGAAIKEIGILLFCVTAGVLALATGISIIIFSKTPMCEMSIWQKTFHWTQIALNIGVSLINVRAAQRNSRALSAMIRVRESNRKGG
jgi:hypothetical protein